ncbi:MAG: hypothetical protein KF914_14780 [Rhizobiaceae bacterium]|nr:hypothetical protein [Rhizobiaceae bacterium]
MATFAFGSFSAAEEIDAYVDRLRRAIDDALRPMKHAPQELKGDWQSGEGG